MSVDVITPEMKESLKDGIRRILNLDSEIEIKKSDIKLIKDELKEIGLEPAFINQAVARLKKEENSPGKVIHDREMTDFYYDIYLHRDGRD